MNYLRGSDPTAWKTNLPTFRSVTYKSVYPGVDLIYYGKQSALEYDFVLAPGADYNHIRLKFSGAERTELNELGELVLHTKIGQVIQRKPIAYQLQGEQRREVEVKYRLSKGGVVSFAVGDHDKRLALIIDPVIGWSTYLGGSDNDVLLQVEVTPQGQAVVLGTSYSIDYPLRSPRDASLSGSSDIVVSKVNGAGNALLWSTYLGGSQGDGGLGLTLEDDNSIVLSGSTSSADYPTTTGAYDRVLNTPSAAIITVLSENGASILYSTFFERGFFLTVALGADGKILVGGGAAASVVIRNGFQSTINGFTEGFFAKFDRTLVGDAQLYCSSFIGGDGNDGVYDIAEDGSGNILLTGRTEEPTSIPFPTTAGHYYNTYSGDSTGFVSKVAEDCSNLLYSTYLSDSGYTEPFRILANSDGYYVAGVSDSADILLPLTPVDEFANAFDATLGGYNGFIWHFNNSDVVDRATLFGDGGEAFFGLALDFRGNVYVSGYSDGLSAPFLKNEFDDVAGGTYDGLVASFNSGLSVLRYASLIGGTGDELPYDIAIDSAGDAYIAGYTTGDYPTLGDPAPIQAAHAGGSSDGFVTKLIPPNADPLVGWLALGTPDNSVASRTNSQQDWCYLGKTESGNCDAALGPSQYQESFTSAALDPFTTITEPLMPPYLDGAGPYPYLEDGRVLPYVTSSWTGRFNTPASGTDVCWVLRHTGSEAFDIFAYMDGGAKANNQTRIYGLGEDLFRTIVFAIPNFSGNSVLNFGIDYVPGFGAQNGFYIDAMVVGEECTAATLNPASVRTLGASRANAMGQVLWQIGHEDQVTNQTGEGANLEFRLAEGFYQDFAYDVNQNPDSELYAPAVPGVMSLTALAGKAVARNLKVSFTLEKEVTETIAHISYFGQANLSVYVDGRLVGSAGSDSTPGRRLVAAGIKNLEEGTHTLELRAGATLVLDYLMLLDVGKADFDGDGLVDEEERRLKTNLGKSDTDGDGVGDYEEVSAGSNPLDPGSAYPQKAVSKTCLETNGFLGMFNILETRNKANANRRVRATLLSREGKEKSRVDYGLAANSQFDLLVHDMAGFERDAIGSLCLEQLDGGAGEVSAMMVYIRPSTSLSSKTTGIGLDFSFSASSSPLPAALSHVVPVNTFHPSLRLGDQADLVANWLQISRVADTAVANMPLRGSVKLFDSFGGLLQEFILELSAGERRDLPGHVIGPSNVATARWEPLAGTNAQERIVFRNARYYYDNPFGELSFDTAFQLTGMTGSGEILVGVVDTRNATSVLELINAATEANNINVKFFTSAGVLKYNKTHLLQAGGTKHIIVNDVPGMNNLLGASRVDGSLSGGAAAVVMQYGRTQDLGLSYAYGISARQSFGLEFRSSYNTYLGQSCALTFVNTTASNQKLWLAAFSSAGTQLQLDGAWGDKELMVSANGATEYNLCGQVPVDSYGTINIRAQSGSVLLPSMVRQGAAQGYRFPVPVQ